MILEKSKISLNISAYNFCIDYSTIETEDILNIYEYLLERNNIGQCLDVLSKWCFCYAVSVDD